VGQVDGELGFEGRAEIRTVVLVRPSKMRTLRKVERVYEHILHTASGRRSKLSASWVLGLVAVDLLPT
jgi:hypothetical protein